MPDPVLSFGEKAVGYNSNPTPEQRAQIENVRRKYADRIDEIYSAHISGQSNGEKIAMAKLSIRELQIASYWEIKTITWQD